MNHTCLYSPAAEHHHTGWYSFPVPLRAGGWVGWLGEILRWFVCRRRSPIPVLTGPDVEQFRWYAQRRYRYATSPPDVQSVHCCEWLLEQIYLNFSAAPSRVVRPACIWVSTVISSIIIDQSFACTTLWSKNVTHFIFLNNSVRINQF